MSPPAAFPWREAMAFGLGRLGWPPEHFWAATPRELAAALRAWRREAPGGAIERSAFEALMAACPDR
ncbi:phage tail assembly chaperone [Bosea minatitlanensis]|uniref:Phage tail assembly chaperone n=1 Tax=Bosea minatitlanensis TaxID=128782 RepID=A0ABW0F1I8_9HYPH|nr:phage tail assembly chaperone [Bosea minatitlanensis]MCT4492848.1 phage tail assembly chaperone [Bosea minatitlanensis]